MSVGCRIRRDFPRPDKKLVEAFRGLPIALIAASILSMAVMAFR